LSSVEKFVYRRSGNLIVADQVAQLSDLDSAEATSCDLGTTAHRMRHIIHCTRICNEKTAWQLESRDLSQLGLPLVTAFTNTYPADTVQIKLVERFALFATLPETNDLNPHP
jgi:hypothetical protein